MTEKLEIQLVEDFPFLKKTYPFYGEGGYRNNKDVKGLWNTV